MPTLIVEDGTGVADANTYVDLVYLQAYADDRGLTLPTLDVDKEIYLLLAMDYLEGRRDQFQGSKSVDTQLLQWPRQNVWIDGTEIDTDLIPEELKKAQCQLVVEQQISPKLYPLPITSPTEGQVIEKTIAGVLKKRFSSNASKLASSVSPIVFASVEIFLRPLITCGHRLQTIRI